MSVPVDLEAAAAALFAGTREDFIVARAGLVKATKAAGHVELAGQISALPKPSQTAWAVNRTWWDAPECIRELFVAATELRTALLGGAGPDATEPARARHRAAVSAATARATANLTTVTMATRRRIAATLEALGALGRWPPPGPGCLPEDLDPPGFESLGAVPAWEPGDVGHPELGANSSESAALIEAAALHRRAAARLAICREQHDALLEVHREALAQVEETTVAVARAQALHEAGLAAAQATARDLGQRQSELDEASSAYAEATATLEALRSRASAAMGTP